MSPRAAALALAFVAACGTPDEPPQKKPVERVIVDITGKVQIHPLEAAWRAADPARGEAPDVAGASIALEEALDAVAGLPPLRTATVGADGSFSFEKVDVTNVRLALVAAVKDASGELVPSGYGIVRKSNDRSLADEDLSKKPVYVVSMPFVEALATAIGGKSAVDLANEGFILGQIVDADGKGVEGAQLAKLSPTPKLVETSEDHPLVYFDADLTGTVDGATSGSGLFLFQPGSGTAEYTALKDGLSFEAKLSGSRAKTAVSVFIPVK